MTNTFNMADYANKLIAGPMGSAGVPTVAPKKGIEGAPVPAVPTEPAERTGLTQGIHRGVPMSDYIADPCPEPSLSKGVIKLLSSRSPAHAHLAHPRLSRVDGGGSKESDLGRACHGLFLGHHERVVWVYADDWKKKSSQEARDQARASGAVPLLSKQREQVEAMVAAAHNLADPQDTEVTMVWQERGVWLRCRADWLEKTIALSDGGPWVPDYKTCGCAEPAVWSARSLYAGGYDIQAALYRRAMRHIANEDWSPIWLVGEDKPPYGACWIAPTDNMLAVADKKINKAIDMWRACLESGQYPNYPAGVHWVDPPNYEVYAWEDSE